MNIYNDTVRLYYQDSHLSQFQGTVLDCIHTNNQYKIILDQTSFYPEGGGQPADKGYLISKDSSQKIEVMDVQEEDHIIYHITKEPIEIGSIITGQIDYETRFTAMQHHSGEHIVSGLVHRTYGYNNVGFHMGKDAVTMDFDGVLTEEQIRHIELLANEAIYKNLPILTTHPSLEELEQIPYRSKKEIDGQIRIVSIPYHVDQQGNLSDSYYDICACCAPHVSRTGEIGIIKLISYIKYKGGTRVSMLCGYKALEDYNSKEENVVSISALLSSKPLEIAQAVNHLKKELSLEKSKITELRTQLIAYKAKEIPEDTEHITLFELDIEQNQMRYYCNAIIARCSGIVVLFSGSDQDGYRYIIGSKNFDVRMIGKQLNESFQGRGGGSKEMVQGSLVGSQEQLTTFLSNIFSHISINI